jgi:hypothetical protein
MTSLRFIALLCTFSVLFVAGCQKKAPTPPAIIPTPPANVQPAPEAPTPAPSTGTTAPVVSQPWTWTASQPSRPINQTPLNGKVISIENGVYTIEHIDFSAIFTWDNKPLQKAEFDALSDEEKKAYSAKNAELAKKAPRKMQKVIMTPETIYILPEITNEKDANGIPVRKMNTWSIADISTSSTLNILTESNSDWTYTALRVIIQNPPKNQVPQS